MINRIKKLPLDPTFESEFRPIGKPRDFKTVCPNPECRAVTDSLSLISDGGIKDHLGIPLEGDLATCAYCQCVCKFKDGGLVLFPDWKEKLHPEAVRRIQKDHLSVRKLKLEPEGRAGEEPC